MSGVVVIHFVNAFVENVAVDIVTDMETSPWWS